MHDDDEMRWMVKNVMIWLAIWLAGFVSGMVARGADMPVGQLQGVTNLVATDRIFVVRSNGAARLLTNWNDVLVRQDQLADGTNSVAALVGTTSNALASVMVRNTNGVATNLTATGEWLKIMDFSITNYPGTGMDIWGSSLLQTWGVDGSVDQHGDFFYWGTITDSNHITTKAWVENAVSAATNGLAGTNLIYRVLPGTNMVAVTNGWDVVLSSTAAGGGDSTTNFAGINVTNQIWMPAPSTRAIVADADSKKISIFNSFTDASNCEEGFLRWETNTLKLGTAAAGTGTKRSVMLSVDENVFVTLRRNPTYPTMTDLIDKHGRVIFSCGQIHPGYNSGQSGWSLAGGVTGTNQFGFIRIGEGAGSNQTGTSDLGNIDIGTTAGNSCGRYNVNIGHNASGGGYGYGQSYLTMVGYYAGNGRNNGHYNIGLGYYALAAQSTLARTISNSVAIGIEALRSTNTLSATTNVVDVIAIGWRAGYDVPSNTTNSVYIGPMVVNSEPNSFVIHSNMTALIGGHSRTNALIQLSATNAIINAPITVNGQAGKSVTNIWYSVTSDGTGVVTNRQVFLNGILVSWQVNGSEL